MNTGRVCIFTTDGSMHQAKVQDIPYGKFRDKGQPIDNVSNYDSSKEEIIYLCDERQLYFGKFLFVTKQGMIKVVDGKEFQAGKRSIVASKLQEGDRIVSISILSSNQNIVFMTEREYMLRISASDVPEKKKNAIGVRGMKLQKDDAIEAVYLFEEGNEKKVTFHEKEISLNRLKLAKRDGVGTKIRK